MKRQYLREKEGYLTVILDKYNHGTLAAHIIEDGKPQTYSHRTKISQDNLEAFIRMYGLGSEKFSKLAVIFEEGVKPSTAKDTELISSNGLIEPSAEKVARQLAKEYIDTKYTDEERYPVYKKNKMMDQLLSIHSINDPSLQNTASHLKGEHITNYEALHASMANSLLPENSRFQFKASSELQEKANELLADNLPDWKGKLMNIKHTSVQPDQSYIELNDIPNPEEYPGAGKASYILNCQDEQEQITYINIARKVDYIGMKDDATIHQGIKRAEAYMEWAVQADKLGYEPQINAQWFDPLPTQINPALLNTDKRTRGHLGVGTIHFEEAIDMAKVYPEATLTALKQHHTAINEALSTVSYDLKNHTISNQDNTVQIPYEAWTNYYEKGLISATEGKLEHVGGYIASMANIKEPDAKKLLSSNQMIQYQEAEQQKRENSHVQEQSKPTFKIKIQSKPSKSQDLGR